jgi:predicted metal-dependent HD superfamily phosphohydrolase
MFLTAQPHAYVRYRRAIERRALWMAEDAARELPHLPLEDALQLVHLYFECGSRKAEPAARRWLVRYLSEGSPSLRDVAKVTASLAEHEWRVRERLA